MASKAEVEQAIKDGTADTERRTRAVPITGDPQKRWVLLPSGQRVPYDPVVKQLVALGSAVEMPKNGVPPSFVAALQAAAVVQAVDVDVDADDLADALLEQLPDAVADALAERLAS